MTNVDPEDTVPDMTSLSARALVLVLLLAFVPGVGELMENAVHLAAEGHFAHATHDGDVHDPGSDEHGCTGAIHTCSCCLSLSVLPARAAVVSHGPRISGSVTSSFRWSESSVFRGVFHPPEV